MWLITTVMMIWPIIEITIGNPQESSTVGDNRRKSLSVVSTKPETHENPLHVIQRLNTLFQICINLKQSVLDQ